MARRALGMGGGQLAGEIAAEGEHAVLGQPRRGTPRGLPEVVLEGFVVHGVGGIITVATIPYPQSRMTH